MNRRGFISTITALAGIVLAKIKAPGPTLHTFTIPANSLQVGDTIHPWTQVQTNYGHLYFTDKHIYILDKDGLHKWQPTSLQQKLIDTNP